MDTPEKEINLSQESNLTLRIEEHEAWNEKYNSLSREDKILLETKNKPINKNI